MSQSRHIAIVATVVAVCCSLAAVPMAAFGDDAPAAPEPSPEFTAALEVRAEVAELNEFAQEQAPPAVGNSCGATLDVPGIGDTCVTPEGLLRVEQADGRSHTIHGVDAPPTGASAFAPGSQAAVDGASVADVTCVPADQPHYVLVYARPGNVPSRYTTIAPKLRTEAYRLSAFIDGESRAVDASASKRLPMRCDGGTPTVLDVPLANLAAGSADFKAIVDAFRAKGYQYNGDGGGNQRYIVYYDAPSPSGAAGTGHVFTPDSSVGATNQNNKGGLYAIEYRYDNGGGLPHWEVLIHETIHTMGAVVAAAPHSSGAEAGHCNDGQDVMCYADGGSTSNYTATTCATKVLDCGRDDYFNPRPAAGSYLATHWNPAATYNRFLVHGAAGDTSAPTTVTGLAQTGASNSAIGVAWQPAADDAGAATYVVSVREAGGVWRDVATTGRTSASVSGLAPTTAYEVGVLAKDASGNRGAQAVLAASTTDRADVTPPAAPGGVAVKATRATATLTWNDAADDVGVAAYDVRQRASGTQRAPRAAGSTPDTTITIPLAGLTPGVRYQFEVVARDHAANVSPGAVVTVVVAKDTKRPTAPSRLRVVTTSRSMVTIQWNPSTDDTAVTGYRVSQRVGGRWVFRGDLAGDTRRLRLVRLRAKTAYTFRIVARDRAGNSSVASRPITVRTR